MACAAAAAEVIRGAADVIPGYRELESGTEMGGVMFRVHRARDAIEKRCVITRVRVLAALL